MSLWKVGVHMSVWVEFVRNLRPTQPNWVEDIQTRNSLVRESDQSGWTHVGLRLKPSMTEEMAKTLQFKQTLTRFDINLVRSKGF